MSRKKIHVPPTGQQLRVSPPLDADEIAFLEGFAADAAVRRLWPGQPGAHTPWLPTADGALELDEAAACADPASVVPWLRFLVGELLAPRTPDAFERALDQGLSCGHRICGRVLVERSRVVTIVDHHIRERRITMIELFSRTAEATEWSNTASGELRMSGTTGPTALMAPGPTTAPRWRDSAFVVPGDRTDPPALVGAHELD